MKILSQLLLLCLLQLPGKLLLVVKIRDLKKVFHCYCLANETLLPLTIRRNNRYSSAHFNSDFEVQSLTNQYFCMSLRIKQNLSQLINEWKVILKVQSLSHLRGHSIRTSAKNWPFWTPSPPCTHFRPQRPDPLPFSTSARPDPLPPQKKRSS